MFNNWKSQFQSLGREDRGERKPSEGEPEQEADDAQVSRLRNLLADLRGGIDEGGQSGPDAPAPSERAASAAPIRAVASAEPTGAPVSSKPAAGEEEALAEAAEFLAQQRKAAEVLLLELSSAEERLKEEAIAARAARERAAARETANAAAEREQQARTLVSALGTRQEALAAQRRETDAQIALGRTSVQSAEAEAADLERRLADARHQAAQAALALEEHERQARDAAASAAALQGELAQAQERVTACQLAYVTAEREAQAAKERADGVKSSLLPAMHGADRFGNIQKLAARIAEDAAVLAPDASWGAEVKKKAILSA